MISLLVSKEAQVLWCLLYDELLLVEQIQWAVLKAVMCAVCVPILFGKQLLVYQQTSHAAKCI